jgi:hypothetical protein
MSDKRLYIIGNGFDIFHGGKSRYSDFKEYVKNNNKKLFEALEEYFNGDELWSDFEETLAYIDTDKIVDDASDFLVPYGADDWSDAFHHDYQFEVQRAIKIITVTLKEHFTNWILSIDIPNESKLNLSTTSHFLTFNYTDTLERNYHISPSKIIYIHNKAINQTSTLILGHSRQQTSENSFDKESDWEEQDIRISEGNRILDKYFKDTYKNTDTIISENQYFFRQLKNMEEVFVLGHSISPVDIKYFQTIFNTVSQNTTWTVSYYDDNQKLKLTKTLISIGISEDKIILVKLTDL